MKNIKDIYWTQKDGTRIALSDMDTPHIVNCVRMLYRAIASRPDEYSYGEPEGEMAQDAFHAEIRHNDRIENTYLTQIEAFKKVLYYRGEDHELKRLRDYKRGL